MNKSFIRTITATAMALVSAQGMSETLILEEVTVTAQKRVQTLQEVPISVAVLSGDRLRDAGIENMEGASEYIPNFKVSRNAIQDTVSIRGVNSDLQAGGEQSVGIFVDGVYRGRGGQSRIAFLDVERLEVLRGPQGTLFGKNTIAGALNITSRQPTEEFDAQLSAMYEFKYDMTEFSGYVSGPLTDNLRGRVAFFARDLKEGWVNNAYWDVDEPQNSEWAGRVSLDWDATDNLTASLKYEHYDFDIEGAPYEIFVVSDIPSSLAPISTQFLLTLGLIDDEINGNSNIGPGVDPLGGHVPQMDEGTSFFNDGDGDELALTLDWAVGSGTLTSILAHSEYGFERFNDADFGPLGVVNFYDNEDYDQNSLELRFTSDTGESFEYLVGSYYQNAELNTAGDTQFWAPGALAALGMNGMQRINYLDQESDTWALFAQLTWRISHAWRLTVGGRYTDEKKTALQGAHLYAKVDATTPFNPAGPELPNFIVAALNPLIEMGDGPHDNALELKEDDFSPTISLQWDATDDVMVYSNFSQGFKGGGFNAIALKPDPTDAVYDPEKATAFEVGSKLRLAGGAAQLNVAVFSMKFDDMQTTLFTGNTGFVVVNAAEATSKGVELDGRWQATDKLMFSASVGYIDFQFDSYENAGCTGRQIYDMQQAGLGVIGSDCSNLGINNLTGRTNQDVPEWSASLSAEYIQPIGAGYELRLVGDMNYTDDYYATADLDENTKQGSYTKFNASVMFAPVSGKWDISVITRNLSDEKTYSYANDVPLFPDSHFGAIEPGRTIALRGRYNF